MVQVAVTMFQVAVSLIQVAFSMFQVAGSLIQVAFTMFQVAGFLIQVAFTPQLGCLDPSSIMKDFITNGSAECLGVTKAQTQVINIQ
jgi:hypothetical protein